MIGLVRVQEGEQKERNRNVSLFFWTKLGEKPVSSEVERSQEGELP